MKKINNKMVCHIDGYLDAISDIDASQRELTIRINYVYSLESNIANIIKFITDCQNNPVVIRQKTYTHYGVTFFLEKLLLIKPFSGLYDLNNQYSLPENLIVEYRNYVIFHLNDYIDFAFDNESIEHICKKDIQLTLLEEDNQFVIALQINIQNTCLVFRFYRQDFDEISFINWFDSVVNHHEAEVLNYEQKSSKNTIYNNSLNLDKFMDEERKEINSLIKKVIIKGKFTEEIIGKLDKYFSKKEIQNLQKRYSRDCSSKNHSPASKKESKP